MLCHILIINPTNLEKKKIVILELLYIKCGHYGESSKEHSKLTTLMNNRQVKEQIHEILKR